MMFETMGEMKDEEAEILFEYSGFCWKKKAEKATFPTMQQDSISP